MVSDGLSLVDVHGLGSYGRQMPANMKKVLGRVVRFPNVSLG